jgi:small subunit ribosomal protein S5
VLELGGVRDVLTKSIGTQNPINLVKATMDGLMRLRRPEQVAELRGLSVKQVLGLDLKPEDGGQATESAGEEPAEPVAVAADPEAAPEPAAGEPPAEDPAAPQAADEGEST